MVVRRQFLIFGWYEPMPVVGKLQDIRCRDRLGMTLVDHHQALSRLEPTQSFPVDAPEFFADGRVEVEAFANPLTLAREALEPVVFVGGTVDGVHRRKQSNETPRAIGLAMPNQVGRTEALRTASASPRNRHVEHHEVRAAHLNAVVARCEQVICTTGCSA